MRMMLRVGVADGKMRPSDAHDAGRGCGFWGKGCPADAHDARRGCGVLEKGAQLMLMMLGVGAPPGKKGALMLVLLGVGAAPGKKGALMLVLLGVGAAWEKGGLADAHDAGCGVWEKEGPADAVPGKTVAQPMLMMHRVGAASGQKKEAQLMLMMQLKTVARMMLMMLGVGAVYGK